MLLYMSLLLDVRLWSIWETYKVRLTFTEFSCRLLSRPSARVQWINIRDWKECGKKALPRKHKQSTGVFGQSFQSRFDMVDKCGCFSLLEGLNQPIQCIRWCLPYKGFFMIALTIHLLRLQDVSLRCKWHGSRQQWGGCKQQNWHLRSRPYRWISGDQANCSGWITTHDISKRC